MLMQSFSYQQTFSLKDDFDESIHKCTNYFCVNMHRFFFEIDAKQYISIKHITKLLRIIFCRMKKKTSASQYVFKFSYSCMFSLLITLNNFLNNVGSKIEPFIRPSIEYGILYRHCQAWYQITWLEYSNEFLSLPSSSIHNSQYFSWICGLVVLYRAVGTGGTGGTIPPP